jgi:16S rRNA (guanine527-N7)-methyltransferase
VSSPAAGSSSGPRSSTPAAVGGPAAGPARALFGARLDLAARYAELLTTEGVVRGLIGPREAPRIWERHLLNCAAVAELIEPGAALADVGSGAGLPGLVLAIARPDLSVVLVEPMARRTAFLSEVVSALGLDAAVTVLRTRAEEATDRLPGGPADVVTARAVAPLDRLAGWCLPLAKAGGRLLAIKGASASAEAAAHEPAIRRLGGRRPAVRVCGVGLLDPATTVVEVVRERPAVRPPGRRRTAPANPSTSDGSGTRSGARRR